MTHLEFAVFAGFAFVYSLVAGRVERSVVSGPMVCLAVGFVIGPYGLRWVDARPTASDIETLVELTLALVLFTDAASANTRVLRRTFRIPGRMLLLGLPGSMLLGSLAAAWLLGSLTMFEAAILGTMLAATDAALGKPVITNKDIPSRFREGLNVESGLNDGLCVPVLLVFIALAQGTTNLGEGLALGLVASKLGIGAAVGLGTTLIGAMLMKEASERGWISEVWVQIPVVALAILNFTVAETLHGSGFIAAFTGGLLFGILEKGSTERLTLAAKGVSETFALLTWLIFGMTVVGVVFDRWNINMVCYALVSLTAVRIIPVFASLTGSGVGTEGKLFLSWFGPRGLASIVFAIMVLDAKLPGAETIAVVVVLTIAFSLVAHGITANPWARRLARIEAGGAEAQRSSSSETIE